MVSVAKNSAVSLASIIKCHKTNLTSQIQFKSLTGIRKILLSSYMACNTPNSRYFSTSPKKQSALESKDILIPVPYGNIAAKAWGKETGYPVLALHGWLDNCGTFDRLIPLLSRDLYIVALDAPGHGLSCHKPPGFIYKDLDLIVDFKRVVDFLGWQRFHMIGHSMGGTLALLYSSIFPESVNQLVVLDILKPTSRSLKKFPDETIKAIVSHLEIEKKLTSSPPIYTLEKAAVRLKKGMFDEITLESAEVLIKRGTKLSDCGNGFVFTRDLRCRTVEQFSRVSHETSKQFMSNVKSELLVIMANGTHPNYKTNTPEVLDEFTEVYQNNCKKFVLKTVEGNHFVHLNNPERVAPLINDFISSTG